MTIRRILVPLDGSRLAESALRTAASVAQTMHAQVLLLHVLEQDPPPSVHGEPHLATARDAAEYLDRHAEVLRNEGIDVESHVHERAVRNVAAAVDQHTHELGADLIAMCAHGRANPRERLLGTIAERILRGGSIPILLRTVRQPQSAPFTLQTLLVPLDFRHDVDAALDAARTFATAYGASITLLTVPEDGSPAASRLLPGASALAREFDEVDAQEQIEALAARLRSERFDARALLAEDEPSEAIAAARESLPAELIVLVTDVHGGLASWYDPSTGQRLLAMPDLTLLLIKEL
jgi:nucleotide-binding universal stress UspA family protein